MQSKTRQNKRQRKIRLFNTLLRFSAVFAKSKKLTPISGFILRRFADLTFLFLKGQRYDTAAGLAREWQRMFPSKAFVPIKEITSETVYAEIHGNCPLAGTGDAQACYRLMEYDRHLLKKMGGQLIVLDSKADPAFPVCLIAIRAQDKQTDDLTPAHLKRSPTIK